MPCAEMRDDCRGTGAAHGAQYRKLLAAAMVTADVAPVGRLISIGELASRPGNRIS